MERRLLPAGLYFNNSDPLIRFYFNNSDPLIVVARGGGADLRPARGRGAAVPQPETLVGRGEFVAAVRAGARSLDAAAFAGVCIDSDVGFDTSRHLPHCTDRAVAFSHGDHRWPLCRLVTVTFFRTLPAPSVLCEVPEILHARSAFRCTIAV